MSFKAMASIIGAVCLLQLPACTKMPEPAAAPEAPASGGAPASAQPGLKAYIDPATGELGVPPAAASAAPAAGAGDAGNVAAPALRVDAQERPKMEGRDLGNGVIYYEVPQERMVDEVVCVQADGSLSSNCPKKK